MILTLATLHGIAAGEIDLVFRRWRKPTVKIGGSLRTEAGVVSIEDIDVIEASGIDDAQAKRAGFASAGAVLHELTRARSASGKSGALAAGVEDTRRLYRVRVSFAGPDDRVARRNQLLTAEELEGLIAKLDAMDARSKRGAWVRQTLNLIAAWPARRAPELAEMHGYDTLPWKAQVRRLKELGLTESLPVGYRLSPLGEQVLASLGGV